MIQDIAPHQLGNAYAPRSPEAGDTLLFFDAGGRMAARQEEGNLRFPTPEGAEAEGAQYLFSLDEAAWFLARQEAAPPAGYDWYGIRELRDAGQGPALFAAFTAWHLWRWYADSRFCGRCGEKTVPHETERALRCPRCGNVIYPRINPAVIVGVIHGERLLITRYRTGYGHNALVAGFTEIGETLEETVAREVMEETGVRVSHIRYYKSQPWGMAQDLLAGFFCEAEGDAAIRMDTGELKYAQWVRREDIQLQPNNLSLTNEMMRMFRDGKIGADFCRTSGKEQQP